MRLDHLSLDELINYLWMHNTDPIIRRLVDALINNEVIPELQRAGMDEHSRLFENTYSPGEYVTHLLNEIEYLNNELEAAQQELMRVNNERTVDYLEKLCSKIREAENEATYTRRQLQTALQEAKLAKEKMRVWNALHGDLGS